MNALVLGGASCLRADVEALRDLCPEWYGLVVATNDTGATVPPLDAWATLHPEHIVGKWRTLRRRRGYPDATVWSPSRPEIADRLFKGMDDGSSGLYAVSVALELGAERVVLCGVPMDTSPNLFRGEAWAKMERYRLGWERNIDALTGRVRSMSGWTRGLLGAPDADWLNSGGASWLPDAAVS